MKKNLIILVGCPASGKSTWCNHIQTKLKGITQIISRDDIRFSIVDPTEEYFSREKEVFNTFINKIKLELSSNCTENIIVDATHLNEGSRTKLLRNLGKSLKDVNVVAVVFEADVEKCIKRNENRKNTRAFVPESVIKRMYYQMTIPTFEEGFNKIYKYRVD